jgi:hypothetical protein
MTNAFSRHSYTVTPTNDIFFPWLARIAARFQEWQLLGLVVELRTTSSIISAGATPGLGTVSAAFNYDVYSNLPTTKVQVSNMQYAVSGPPNQSIMIPLECDPAQNAARVLHIDQGQSGLDRHFYDFARLDIVTQGSQADYEGAMEIWVTYDILLIKPDLDPGELTPAAHIPLYQLSLGSDATTPFAAEEWGGYAQPLFNNLGVVSDDFGLTFDPTQLEIGWYLLMFAVKGGAVSSISLSDITFNNGFDSHYTAPSTNTYFPVSEGKLNEYGAPNADTTGNSILVHVEILHYDGTGTPTAKPHIGMGTDGTWPSSATGDVIFTQLNSQILFGSSRGPFIV